MLQAMMERSFSNFAEALHFPDFGPKFALHDEHHKSHDDDGENGTYDNGMMRLDDNHFPDIGLKEGAAQVEFVGASGSLNEKMVMNNTCIGTTLDQVMNCSNNGNGSSKKSNNNGKKKRARIGKTREEVENQRMSHIAVERNRRKQMNEHLHVLRSLMPSSYVQRGDQASIIGGAIEFVRELEQLLECLESQKRRRLYEEALPFDPHTDQLISGHDAANLDSLMINAGPNSGVGCEAGLRAETAENKSTIADVEVKLWGFDAFVKILSRRRPGQLIKAISALQDLQFIVLHTNITTIEQTALYSFNIKIGSETRFSAEDIASSVQQIFTFIHANSAI